MSSIRMHDSDEPRRATGPRLFLVTEMPQDHRPAKSVRVLLAEDQA